MTEDIESLSDGSVRIKFESDQNGVIYRDAITLTADEYLSMSQGDIDNIKIQRISNWLSLITPQDDGGIQILPSSPLNEDEI